MSERGFPCTAPSCTHKVHGDCHLEYCPRMDAAYKLLQKLVDLYEDDNFSNACELAKEAKAFLSNDKSWTPEEDAKEELKHLLTTKCDPRTCEKGDTLCNWFLRTGDDYGICQLTCDSCPHDGFVDVSKLLEVNKNEQTRKEGSN